MILTLLKTTNNQPEFISINISPLYRLIFNIFATTTNYCPLSVCIRRLFIFKKGFKPHSEPATETKV